MRKILVCSVWTRRNIAAFVLNFQNFVQQMVTEENDEIILLLKSIISFSIKDRLLREF